MIYNLARFNCYNDTCRGSLIFPVGKWPIKIGLIYDQRCILIAATAAIVRLISLCARKKIERKKKRKKEKKKKGKIHTGRTETWRIGWRRKWLHRDYRGNEELCCKRVVSNYVENDFIRVWYRFFYLLPRDKVSKISIFSKFNIQQVSFDPLCIGDPMIL